MSGVPWDPRLTAWLDRVEARWVTLGLTPPVRTDLRDALVTDLVQAVANGAPVDDLLAVDPVSLAQDAALAAGYDAPVAGPAAAPLSPALARLHHTLSRVDAAVAALPVRVRFPVVALGGAVVGATLGMLSIFPAGVWLIDRVSLAISYRAQGLLAVIMWALVSLLAAGVASMAVRRSFCSSPDRRRLSRSAAIALLASGLGAVMPTTALARAWRYPSQVVVIQGHSPTPGLVLLEVALVVLILLAGLVVAGELTWRRHPASLVQD